MMIAFYLSYVLTYIIGGITMLPLFFLVLFLVKKVDTVVKKQPQDDDDDEIKKKQEGRFYKVGWLQVYQQSQRGIRGGASIGGFVKSYLSSPNPSQQTKLFAVLKFNTLYLYDSELQLDCKHVIHVTDYSVHIYPYGLKDHELYSRQNEIQLRSKKIETYHYYLNCSRCIDKEDWYFALLNASKWTPDEVVPNSTRFDQGAMNHLLSTVHSNQSHFETQWLNALLGRVFLGIYKKQSTRDFFFQKILTKINKLNARRPPFLDEINLRSVDGGHGAPYITEPRLLHLSPLGEYTAEFELYYEGHFRVELETVLRWKYSDRLPALRIDLVLAITLQSIQGKMMLKIKDPPTNRAWLGFYKKPKMEWLIEPVMWEKRIGYAVVSKAIKTKMEEIITETMVLPNMDDMVFSQTEGVGGIFGVEDDYGLAFLNRHEREAGEKGGLKSKEKKVKKSQKQGTEGEQKKKKNNKKKKEEEEGGTEVDVKAGKERGSSVTVGEEEEDKEEEDKEDDDKGVEEEVDGQDKVVVTAIVEKKKKRSDTLDAIPLYANVTDSLVTAEPMPLFTLPNYQQQKKKKKWFNRRQSEQQQKLKQSDDSLLLSTSSESDTPSQRSLKSVMNSKQRTLPSTSKRLLQEFPLKPPSPLPSPSSGGSLSTPMQRLRSKSLPSTEITEISVEQSSLPSNK